MLSFKGRVKVAVKFVENNFLVIFLGIGLGVAVFLLQNQVVYLAKRIFPKNTKVGVIGKYTIDTLPLEISNLISYGLTRLSNNSTPLPAAALSWDVGDQGKKYTFHLDENATWHDGSRLKSKEINYQISGVKMEVINSTVITFQTEDPFSPLPSLLSKPLYKKSQLGLGNYKIKRLRLNANYLSLLSLVKKTPDEKSTLTFRFYPNQDTLTNALKLGEVDCVTGLASVDEFETWPGLTITPKQNTEKYAALFFNTQKNPFSDKRFRQALSYAVQKPEKQIRALTPISPLSWAYNKNVKTYPYDPEHAKTILNDAGDELTTGITINIITTKELVPWAEKIKEDWQNTLGINAEISVSPVINTSQDFDAILAYGQIPADPDQYIFWHSDQPGNITNYSNVRIDKLLEEGRGVFSKEERKRIYQDFQRYLLEDAPAIFLFFPESYQVCRGETSLDLNQ
jgi:peptide/nickel transport system substrate-binding protein